MRKLKFVSVFVLLALLLGVSTSAVMAQEPPPDLSNPEAVGALVPSCQISRLEGLPYFWKEYVL